MEKEFIPYLIAIGVGFATQILAGLKGRKRTNTGVESLSVMVKAQFQDVHAKLKDQDKVIGEVREELKDNGGGTTKDGVRLIREDLSGLKTDVQNLAQVSYAHQTIQMNESQDAVMKFDSRGECVFANEKMVEVLGIAYKDILGRGFLQAIGRTQAERTEFLDEWIDSVEQNIPFQREAWVRHSGGFMKLCDIRATAFRGGPDQKQVLFFYLKVKEIKS